MLAGWANCGLSRSWITIKNLFIRSLLFGTQCANLHLQAFVNTDVLYSLNRQTLYSNWSLWSAYNLCCKPAVTELDILVKNKNEVLSYDTPGGRIVLHLLETCGKKSSTLKFLPNIVNFMTESNPHFIYFHAVGHCWFLVQTHHYQFSTSDVCLLRAV